MKKHHHAKAQLDEVGLQLDTLPAKLKDTKHDLDGEHAPDFSGVHSHLEAAAKELAGMAEKVAPVPVPTPKRKKR